MPKQSQCGGRSCVYLQPKCEQDHGHTVKSRCGPAGRFHMRAGQGRMQEPGRQKEGSGQGQRR